MNKSIASKLFIQIFLSVVSIISIVAVFQMFYYSNYYEKIKIEKTALAMSAFIDDYKNNDYTEEQVNEKISKFNIEHNAYLDINIIEPIEHISEDVNDYFIMVANKQGQSFEVYIDGQVIEPILPSEVTLNKTTLNIAGLMDASTIYPTQINGQEVKQEVLEPGQVIQDLFVITGMFNTKSFSAGYQPFTSEITLEPHKKIGKILYSKEKLPHSDINQVYMFHEVHDKKAVILFNTSFSLHSVHEVMSINKQVLPIILIFSAIIAFIIAKYHSKSVSKPIIGAANMAEEIAKLNFTNALDENRNDELGILSKSVNKLSRSLHQSMTDLSQANLKLERDYKLKLKQEKVLKEFVANISHEFKTPLGVVRSYAEGIQDGIKKDKQGYYLSVIMDEIDNMDKLMNNLLVLSKLESGHSTYQRTSMSLKDMIYSTLMKYDQNLKQRHLTYEISGDFVLIDADRDKMNQVVNNLVTNAIKYAPEDSHITIRGQVTDTFKVTFSNKAQLTPDQNQRIWERFYKADESHNRDIEGTGLGLSIVKTIIEGHGFKCYSQINQDQLDIIIEII